MRTLKVEPEIEKYWRVRIGVRAIGLFHCLSRTCPKVIFGPTGKPTGIAWDPVEGSNSDTILFADWSEVAWITVRKGSGDT